MGAVLSSILSRPPFLSRIRPPPSRQWGRTLMRPPSRSLITRGSLSHSPKRSEIHILSCGNLPGRLRGPPTTRESPALRLTPMSETTGCFDFLRGRRSFNANGEVVAPLKVQQPRRHHGGSEIVRNLSLCWLFLTPRCSPQILAS